MATTRFTIDGESYDYDPDHMTFNEAIMLEKASGLTVGEWETSLARGSAIAIKAMFWLAMRHSGSQVKWSEMDGDFGTVGFQSLDDEGNVITDEAPDEPELPTEADDEL